MGGPGAAGKAGGTPPLKPTPKPSPKRTVLGSGRKELPAKALVQRMGTLGGVKAGDSKAVWYFPSGPGFECTGENYSQSYSITVSVNDLLTGSDGKVKSLSPKEIRAKAREFIAGLRKLGYEANIGDKGKFLTDKEGRLAIKFSIRPPKTGTVAARKLGRTGLQILCFRSSD